MIFDKTKELPEIGTVCELAHDYGAVHSHLKEGTDVAIIAHFNVYDGEDTPVAAFIAKNPIGGHHQVFQGVAQLFRRKKTLAEIEEEKKRDFLNELIGEYGTYVTPSDIEYNLLSQLYDNGYIRSE